MVSLYMARARVGKVGLVCGAVGLGMAVVEGSVVLGVVDLSPPATDCPCCPGLEHNSHDELLS